MVDPGDAAASDGPEGLAILGRANDGRGYLYRYRTVIARRDLPEAFGSWQTVWTWHRRMATEGTWDRVHAKLTAVADVAGLVDWSLSVDSTIARVHEHATNTTRLTGGWIELQESAGRAA